MLQNIAYYMILGKPLLFWGGLIGFLFLIATATSGYLLSKGKVKMNTHKLFAIIVIIIAIIHGLIAFLTTLK